MASMFTDAQKDELKGMIYNSIKEAYAEIACEFAKAAVGAIQRPAHHSQVVSAIDLQTLARVPTPSVAGDYSALFGSIPANYIKEIQTGEFFDLTKLLPKRLSNTEEVEPLVLTLDNSVIKVTKSKSTGCAITDIEQWTTAFTTYMSTLTHKFPQRSQELLQYLSLIRYAARVHSGLGWAIYDYKFRQKAAVDKSLVRSDIDNQLWLTIFTVAPSVLKEEYPLFSKGPTSSASTGTASSGTCNLFNSSGSCSRPLCRFNHVCNRCGGSHSGRVCPDREKPPTRYQHYRSGDRGREQGGSQSHSSQRSRGNNS